MVDLEARKREAIKLLETLAEEQEAKWDELDKVVQHAGDNVVSTRLNRLEDALAEEGSSLWATILFTIGLSFIPVGPIAAWGFQKISVRSRTLLRKLGIGKSFDRGAQRLVSGLPKAHQARLAKDFNKLLVEADTARMQYLTMLGNEFAERMRSVSEQIMDAGKDPPLTVAAAKGPERPEVQSTSRDTPLVTVKEPLQDWIRASNLADQRAVIELKDQIRADDDVDLDQLDRDIEELKAIADLRFDWPTDARLALKRHIESCIWATTFDFNPREKTFEVEKSLFSLGPFHAFPRLKETERLAPPPFGDKFWDELTGRLIEDYVTGQTYKDRGDTGLRMAPGQTEPPATRLAFDLWRLGGKLARGNRDAAVRILKATRQESSPEKAHRE